MLKNLFFLLSNLSDTPFFVRIQLPSRTRACGLRCPQLSLGKLCLDGLVHVAAVGPGVRDAKEISLQISN